MKGFVEENWTGWYLQMFFFSFGLLFSGPVQVAEKDVPESNEAKPTKACSWNVQ